MFKLPGIESNGDPAGPPEPSSQGSEASPPPSDPQKCLNETLASSFALDNLRDPDGSIERSRNHLKKQIDDIVKLVQKAFPEFELELIKRSTTTGELEGSKAIWGRALLITLLRVKSYNLRTEHRTDQEQSDSADGGSSKPIVAIIDCVGLIASKLQLSYEPLSVLARRAEGVGARIKCDLSDPVFCDECMSQILKSIFAESAATLLAFPAESTRLSKQRENLEELRQSSATMTEESIVAFNRAAEEFNAAAASLKMGCGEAVFLLGSAVRLSSNFPEVLDLISNALDSEREKLRPGIPGLKIGAALNHVLLDSICYLRSSSLVSDEQILRLLEVVGINRRLAGEFLNELRSNTLPKAS